MNLDQVVNTDCKCIRLLSCLLSLHWLLPTTICLFTFSPPFVISALCSFSLVIIATGFQILILAVLFWATSSHSINPHHFSTSPTSYPPKVPDYLFTLAFSTNLILHFLVFLGWSCLTKNTTLLWLSNSFNILIEHFVFQKFIVFGILTEQYHPCPK